MKVRLSAAAAWELYQTWDAAKLCEVRANLERELQRDGADVAYCRERISLIDAALAAKVSA